MFCFEDEPHDDGTCVHEAVESMVGEIVDVAMPSPFKARGLETVRMMIVQAYPAFFIGRRETMRRSMRTARPALSINVSISRKEPTCPISTTFP